MQVKSFGDHHVLRLDSGEDPLGETIRFLSAERIGFSFISAAGGVSSIRLGYWDATTRKYRERDFQEQLEVLSFTGNSSSKEGKPFLHIHAVLGRGDYSTLGGHVKAARIHPTLEVWVRATPFSVERTKDEVSGLDLLNLS